MIGENCLCEQSKPSKKYCDILEPFLDISRVELQTKNNLKKIRKDVGCMKNRIALVLALVMMTALIPAAVAEGNEKPRQRAPEGGNAFFPEHG